jgi:hypothetical protein
MALILLEMPTFLSPLLSAHQEHLLKIVNGTVVIVDGKEVLHQRLDDGLGCADKFVHFPILLKKVQGVSLSGGLKSDHNTFLVLDCLHGDPDTGVHLGADAQILEETLMRGPKSGPNVLSLGLVVRHVL